MILVVGATGQLGRRIVKKLASRGRSVRALCRPTSKDRDFGSGVEIVFGDLRDPESIDRAVAGARVVIATANVLVPQGKYSFEETEGRGYATLLEACKRHRVEQLVFCSAPITPHDERVDTFKYKRRIERMIADSGVPHSIFRTSLFMDDWLVQLGSSIPLVGAEGATMQRPHWVTSLGKPTARFIEDHGLALVRGNGRARHAFIAVDDVAEVMVRAVGDPKMLGIFDLGGPEHLAWDEAVDVFARVLGRPVRGIRLPAAAFRALAAVLEPLSPAAASAIGINWIVSHVDTPLSSAGMLEHLNYRPQSMEEFLRERLAAAQPKEAAE